METTTSKNSEESSNLILNELKSIKQKIDETQTIGDWINQPQLKKFLQKKETSFREFLKTGELKYSQIGRKHFFKKADVIEMLEKNIIKQF